MNEVNCPGLPADWLNAWLASVGLLVLEPRLRLGWTPDANPAAVLTTDGEADPLTLAADAWPQLERLAAMPIAEHARERLDMNRTVPLEVFRQRAELARGHVDGWTLSSTVTDLCVDVAAESTVRHAPLDPKGPGTIKWLHHRLLKSHSLVENPSEAVIATLRGHGKRVVANGLGFDATRISGLADDTVNLVDPVIEVLAFFGLRLLPMRGDGVEVGRSGTRNRFATRQRCWSLDPNQPSRIQHMTWPAWTRPLDLSAIDALLDVWADLSIRSTRSRRTPRAALSRLGIHAAWQTRPYQKRGSGDTTVGFTSTAVALNAERR